MLRGAKLKHYHLVKISGQVVRKFGSQQLVAAVADRLSQNFVRRVECAQKGLKFFFFFANVKL